MIVLVNGRHYLLHGGECGEVVGVYPMDEHGHLTQRITRVPWDSDYLEVAKIAITAVQNLERLAA